MWDDWNLDLQVVLWNYMQLQMNKGHLQDWSSPVCFHAISPEILQEKAGLNSGQRVQLHFNNDVVLERNH